MCSLLTCSVTRDKDVLHEVVIFSYSVKLKIKSFRVPELFIEIPETATVGSLKVSNQISLCLG